MMWLPGMGRPGMEMAGMARTIQWFELAGRSEWAGERADRTEPAVLCEPAWSAEQADFDPYFPGL